MSREILGQSPAVLKLIELIRKVGPSHANVLIIGESGTGKELVARRLHQESAVRGHPFVPVNCGAIPENLIESELFGHKRGSFTGAVSDKAGLFEVAQGGTLFLDEVGELPLNMQVKLLRALQEKSVRRVGDTHDIKVDARIISATNRDLEAGIARGSFREDLYYRLNVIQIKTPPLRDRGSDIRLLAQVFLDHFSKKQGKSLIGFEPGVLECLEHYSWPGNIRELENSLERAVTLSTSDHVSRVSLPAALQIDAAVLGVGGSVKVPGYHFDFPDFSKHPIQLESVVRAFELELIAEALRQSGGKKERAALFLGVPTRTLTRRIKG